MAMSDGTDAGGGQGIAALVEHLSDLVRELASDPGWVMEDRELHRTLSRLEDEARRELNLGRARAVDVVRALSEGRAALERREHERVLRFLARAHRLARDLDHERDPGRVPHRT